MRDDMLALPSSVSKDQVDGARALDSAEALKVFGTRLEWKEPPVCALCLGPLALIVSDVVCLWCGEIAMTLQSANAGNPQSESTVEKSTNTKEDG